MSHGPDDPNSNYDDQSDGNGSTFIQIDLPSTRVEVPADHLLFKEIGGGKYKEIKAKDIKKNDYLFVMRDDKCVTEMVLEKVKPVPKKLPTGSIRNGTIIVNNVLTRHQQLTE